ncbi:putative phosphatase regulatory subunit-domain-containing protein [Thelonectria olida]|uniref:Phosphatase regulatory subunit-domain-containing protein n=1 Tax=Thelonectria olida TaxID=1576542 RepID=A0A9P9AK68_9HYPO|nr:putative phosphatase regulatory subunit-domain-containing protein [Thelonectria olida]
MVTPELRREVPYTPLLKPSPRSPPSETAYLDKLPQALRESGTHESFVTLPPSDIVAGLRASCNAPHKSDNAVLTEDEDEIEGWRQSKQRVIRKMSGELVRPILRPPSRRCPASMPTSPTATKSVHFHSHLEETLNFYRLDCPLSIGAGSQSGQVYKSSRERPMSRQDAASQWEMVTPNFPRQSGSRESQFVYIKKLRLLDDQNPMQGLVAVRNVALQKSVTCRFMFDNWKTTSDVAAAYSDGNASEEAPSGYDFFVFTIELSDIINLKSKIAYLRVCFFKKTSPRDGNVLA